MQLTSELTVDLERCIVSGGGRELPFDFDRFARHSLLNGLDDIALTLEHEEAISAFEAARPRLVDTRALP
jgi:3-isopropylmalate/(R)-2-methylmalate dehydratase small subunit